MMISRETEKPVGDRHRILIDAFVLLPPERGAGGAGRYLHSLLGRWNNAGVNARVIASPRNHHLFAEYRNLEIAIVGGQDHWHYLPHFEWADVYYSPLNGLWPRLIPERLPVVACLHDLQHLVFPHFFSREMWEARNRDYGFAIERADRLIAISRFEQENVRRFFGKSEVDLVYHGGYTADLIDAARAPPWIGPELEGAPFVLYPAVPWPHKNHGTLVQAWSLYKRIYRGPERLVLTGASEHDHARCLAKRLGRGCSDGRGIVLAGFQDDATQAWLLKNSRALLFPSLYEGFGIPVLEAMKLGTPVCATRLPSIEEFAGDAICYFADPLDPSRMAEDINRLMSDVGYREELARLGMERSAEFSTSRMAEDTLACLMRAIRMRSDGSGVVSVTERKFTNYDEVPAIAAALIITPEAIRDPASMMGALRAQWSSMESACSSIYVICPMSIATESLQDVRSFAEDAGLRLRFFHEDHPYGITLALEDILATGGATRYLLMGHLQGRLTSAGNLRLAVAELDYFSDLHGAFFESAKPGGVSQIVRPEREDKAFLKYMALKKEPLLPFLGSLLRTSCFREYGLPGTRKFLASFLKNCSYLSIPI